MPESDNTTLTVEEQDGSLVLKAVGGTRIPSTLAVVDEAGNRIGAYTADAASQRSLNDLNLMLNGLDLNELPQE